MVAFRIVLPPMCFLKGVRLRTPGGEARVETLRPGDAVITGEGAAKRVRWVGVQTLAAPFADPITTAPILIRQGALGEGLPHRDLRVSPGHALFLDGLLINAGALANGVSIVRETALPERFQYFHIELDEHALIIAEGARAETFLDAAEPTRFDNGNERAALLGETEPLLEMPYPRIKAARQIPPVVLNRLAAAAALLGAERAVA